MVTEFIIAILSCILLKAVWLIILERSTPASSSTNRYFKSEGLMIIQAPNNYDWEIELLGWVYALNILHMYMVRVKQLSGFDVPTL